MLRDFGLSVLCVQNTCTFKINKNPLLFRSVTRSVSGPTDTGDTGLSADCGPSTSTGQTTSDTGLSDPTTSDTGLSDPTFPFPDNFFGGLKEMCPSACVLTAVMEVDRSEPTPMLTVLTPTEKIINFKKDDSNSSTEFCERLKYSPSEIRQIESATIGQANNPNWLNMRKHVLTSSKFKTICHFRKTSATAETLFNGSSLDENALPAPIKYGRKETKARHLFM